MEAGFFTVHPAVNTEPPADRAGPGHDGASLMRPALRSLSGGRSARRESPDSPRVSVIIPTLNEAQNIVHVFAELPRRLHEVIVVDGFSTDGTPDVARSLRPDVKIVHQQRRGKGDALRCGFEAATGDIVVMLDADGSANAAEIPAFVEALVSGADFAKASHGRDAWAPDSNPQPLSRDATAVGR